MCWLCLNSNLNTELFIWIINFYSKPYGDLLYSIDWDAAHIEYSFTLFFVFQNSVEVEWLEWVADTLIEFTHKFDPGKAFKCSWLRENTDEVYTKS